MDLLEKIKRSTIKKTSVLNLDFLNNSDLYCLDFIETKESKDELEEILENKGVFKNEKLAKKIAKANIKLTSLVKKKCEKIV